MTERVKRFCAYCGERLSICECADRDERLPRGYAEIEYYDMDTAEARLGATWDDKNYRHYMER